MHIHPVCMRSNIRVCTQKLVHDRVLSKRWVRAAMLWAQLQPVFGLNQMTVCLDNVCSLTEPV